MIPIEALQPADWIAALELVLANVPQEERATHVKHYLNLLEQGVLDPRAIRVARNGQSNIVGVQVCVPLRGASCLFWLPTGSEEAADALVRASLDWCRSQRMKLAQAFATMDEFSLAGPLLRQGFQHITTIHEMQHDLIEIPDQISSLCYVTYQDCRREEFAATLQRTYEGTLDCPELNGKRTIDEIIAGHQGEGKFNPERWWLVYHSEQPVGVLLLAELHDGVTWDLAYVGIVPEERGRGHGRAMVQHALETARAKLATSLIVAVDGRNTPARQLYASAGFMEMESHEVLLHFFT